MESSWKITKDGATLVNLRKNEKKVFWQRKGAIIEYQKSFQWAGKCEIFY